MGRQTSGEQQTSENLAHWWLLAALCSITQAELGWYTLLWSVISLHDSVLRVLVEDATIKGSMVRQQARSKKGSGIRHYWLERRYSACTPWYIRQEINHGEVVLLEEIQGNSTGVATRGMAPYRVLKIMIGHLPKEEKFQGSVRLLLVFLRNDTHAVQANPDLLADLI